MMLMPTPGPKFYRGQGGGALLSVSDTLTIFVAFLRQTKGGLTVLHCDHLGPQNFIVLTLLLCKNAVAVKKFFE